MYTSCRVYILLTAVYLDLTILTSDRVLLLILAASGVRAIFDWASRVMLSVAAFAAWRLAKWCLSFSWVSAGGILDEVPVILLDSVPLSPC